MRLFPTESQSQRTKFERSAWRYAPGETLLLRGRRPHVTHLLSIKKGQGSRRRMLLYVQQQRPFLFKAGPSCTGTLYCLGARQAVFDQPPSSGVAPRGCPDQPANYVCVCESIDNRLAYPLKHTNSIQHGSGAVKKTSGPGVCWVDPQKGHRKKRHLTVVLC